MPATKAYLNRAEQQDLIAWMTGHQGDYARYLEWCERNEKPETQRFTKYYLNRWTQRKRVHFQARARQVEEDLRRQSALDRGRRLKLLEDMVSGLQAVLARETDPNTIVRLTEQIGKTLDRIARERGEYGKPPEEGPTDLELQNMELGKALAAHFTQKRIAEAKVVSP